MCSRIVTMKSTDDYWDKIQKIKKSIHSADAVLIGAGAGLSASAGFTYSGKRFEDNFPDFIKAYGFQDMYSAGFYPYKTLEEYWAYWSRYIYINRYMDAPEPVYQKLYDLVKDKDYFVLTTNVDHCFQKAGFDKNRLFYTQGDYGLFQCGRPCHPNTYDNETIIREMIEAQGYVIGTDGMLLLPKGVPPKRMVPSELVPHCPKCGKPMSMNLRADSTFVEDKGWQTAADRYRAFIRSHGEMKILYLELGVGWNTPGIIKYPFWQMTAENPRAAYVCVNNGEAGCPREIEGQSICIDGDIGEVCMMLQESKTIEFKEMYPAVPVSGSGF